MHTATPARKPNPNIIGKALILDEYNVHFDDRRYWTTGKTGHSIHDGTAVEEYRDDADHRIWKDAENNVHADSHDDLMRFRRG